MKYHFFLVDFKNDSGYMYRVGIESGDDTSLKDIRKYLKQDANEVLYERSCTEIKKRYLKTKKQTPIGNVFMTSFLFDKCMNVPYDHWSCRLRRKVLSRQTDEEFVLND